MRQARIKVPSDEGPGTYHVISRTVNGERLFDDLAKEVLRKQLRQVAAYCGVEIFTYAILSNHFHALVYVPRRVPLNDAELLRRHAILYPRLTPSQKARLDAIRAQLAANGKEAVAWRRRQQALMHDLSPFMKLLKQRFSIWFNRRHHRFGTLWAERFRSALIEPKRQLLETVAAYIDLNAVRAGLAVDPKDYRFCGYAEAVAGSTAARQGLSAVLGARDQPWSCVQADYRLLLFGTGAAPRLSANTISAESTTGVIRAGGRLTRREILRCRLRYFSDGAVLGSAAFVSAQLARLRRRGLLLPRTAPRRLPRGWPWCGLTTLRRLRGPPLPG
ncbi:MAG: transposase [Opitutaceae bacterium]|nr:transposase [Opitutaceae bacterium]